LGQDLGPAVLCHVRQNGHDNDCMVASLATVFDKSYEEVLLAAGRLYPDVLQKGMTWEQAKRTVKRLGLKTKLLRAGRFDPDETTGVLYVARRRTKTAPAYHHVVVLWEGRVLEGNGELWRDLDSYCKANNLKPMSVLVRAD
jgi:hypothetical protein